MAWLKRRVPPRPTPPPPPKKKLPFPWAFCLFVLIWSWFVWDSLTPNLPKPDSTLQLYSNQCGQDIRATLLSAIKEANQSIHLVMFGLSDRPVLSALSKKIQGGIPTNIYYDTEGSPKIFQYLQGAKLHPIKNKGLMHQKILILDQERVFIGSANMTTASLRMHDNLVVGFSDKAVAKFLLEHEPYSPGYLKANIAEQDIELWLLPDPRGAALNELRKKIKNAQRSIRVALFTFTHPALVEELIHAHDRGISVSVVIDMHSGLGASAKIVDKLKNANIPVRLSQGVQLLHHKFIYIDEETLITGSANWTKAAFYKNSDLILSLQYLKPEQKKFMNRLWSSVESGSK